MPLRKLVSAFAATTAFCAVVAVHAPAPAEASDLTDLDIIKKAVNLGLLDQATAALWVKDPKLKRQIPVGGGTEVSKDRLAGSRTVQSKQVTRYFENRLGNRILSNTLTKRWCCGSPEAACVYLHIWSHYDGTSTPTGSGSKC